MSTSKSAKKQQPIQSKNRSPARVFGKKQNDFQPGLYITARLNENDILSIKQAFDTYDSNKAGILSPNDLKVALFHQGFHASRQTIYSIISEYDEDALGGLNFEAFIKIVSGEPIQRQKNEDLKRCFKKIDRDNKGFINRRDLQMILKQLGQQWEQNQIDMILNKIDQESSSKITFEIFCRVMHSPNSFY